MEDECAVLPEEEKRKYYKIYVKTDAIALGKSMISEKLKNSDKVGPLAPLDKNCVVDSEEVNRLLIQEQSVSSEIRELKYSQLVARIR